MIQMPKPFKIWAVLFTQFWPRVPHRSPASKIYRFVLRPRLAICASNSVRRQYLPEWRQS